MKSSLIIILLSSSLCVLLAFGGRDNNQYKASQKNELRDAKIVLNRDIAQQLAYRIVDTAKSADKKNIDELFKTLQSLSKTCKGGRIIKELLFGATPDAELFSNYMINRLCPYTTLQRECNFSQILKIPYRKQKLTALYLGTPCSIEYFLKTTKEVFELFKDKKHDLLQALLDVKKVNRAVTKYRMVCEGPPSGCIRSLEYKVEDGIEIIEEDEPLGEVLKKFPKSTQAFLKNFTEKQGIKI